MLSYPSAIYKRKGFFSMQTETILRAYAAIGESTPLCSDCGALCAAACCLPDEDGQGGVDLLPGEEILIGDVDWMERTHDAHMDAEMIRCKAMCAREKRPFLCRVFPLCPVIGRDGRWTVRMDARARAMCPLTRGGVRGLDPEFVRGCVRAVRILAEEPDGADFLHRWVAIEAEFRRPIL